MRLLPLRIALRYLVSKKSHTAVSVISTIAVCAVAVTALAMICVLSVFNGFYQACRQQDVEHGAGSQGFGKAGCDSRRIGVDREDTEG